MKIQTIISLTTVLLACSASSQSLINLYSFPVETKIKGRFTIVQDQLYFACEKGGAANSGYIGKFDPASATLTPVFEFPGETKVKDGFSRVGDELWFVCEKGGDFNFGYIGSFNLADNTVKVLHSFPQETKPKSAPLPLNSDGYYFLTERLGDNGVGALMRYKPGAGVATVASFSLETGIKAESRPFWHNGKLYYAAREGGDTTQLSGKGAGAIGTIDLLSGTVTKLADLNAQQHLAKIKTLLPFDGKLYYTAEEGGDLTLNSGKGFGGLGYYDPASSNFTRLFVADQNTGTKPRGLVAIDDELYFNCGEGGPNGFGTFGVITDRTNVAILGHNDLAIGSKSDVGITHFGNRIYFVTELGCANFLGGISAYELYPSDSALPPRITLAVSGNSLELSWPASANHSTLETSATSSGPWTPVAAPGITNITLPATSSSAFFRLRSDTGRW